MVLKTPSVEQKGDDVGNQIKYWPKTLGKKSAKEHRGGFLFAMVSALY